MSYRLKDDITRLKEEQEEALQAVRFCTMRPFVTKIRMAEQLVLPLSRLM
jgi:hypothetical protein